MDIVVVVVMDVIVMATLSTMLSIKPFVTPKWGKIVQRRGRKINMDNKNYEE